jgi:hypothetical protein
MTEIGRIPLGREAAKIDAKHLILPFGFQPFTALPPG